MGEPLPELYREPEAFAVGHALAPCGNVAHVRRAVKGVIDLDAVHERGKISEVVPSVATGRVDNALPIGIIPARDTDMDAGSVFWMSHGVVLRANRECPLL